MKKHYLLLVTSFILTGCVDINSIFNKTSESSKESSSEIESIISESISEKNSISESISESTSSFPCIKKDDEYVPTTTVKYTNIDTELYLEIDETYSIKAMLSNYLNMNVESLNTNYVTVEKDLVIKGKDYGDSLVTIYKDKDNYQQIIVHVVDDEEYGSYFTSTDVGRFYNKDIVFFGDSITHNWLEYTHDMEPTGSKGEYGWTKIFNERCKFKSYTNAACSGGTMAIPKTGSYGEATLRQDKSFPYCVNRNIEAVTNCDYVFVYYGTNDYGVQMNLINGTLGKDKITDLTKESSVAAGMKYGILKIKEVNPDCKIFFINASYRTYPPYVVKTKELSEYNDIIGQVALAYMCKVIDNASLINKDNYQTYLNEDGLHLNDKGFKALVDFILSNNKDKE